MKLTKVKVLHSRTRLGHRGDVIHVAPDRLNTLLKAGLVEKVKVRKSKGEDKKDGSNKRSDS